MDLWNGHVEIIGLWHLPKLRPVDLMATQQGVRCQYSLAIYIKKYVKAKEELCKLKYFTTQT
jgi:hypothetical protein